MSSIPSLPLVAAPTRSSSSSYNASNTPALPILALHKMPEVTILPECVRITELIKIDESSLIKLNNGKRKFTLTMQNQERTIREHRAGLIVILRGLYRNN